MCACLPHRSSLWSWQTFTHKQQAEMKVFFSCKSSLCSLSQKCHDWTPSRGWDVSTAEGFPWCASHPCLGGVTLSILTRSSGIFGKMKTQASESRSRKCHSLLCSTSNPVFSFVSLIKRQSFLMEGLPTSACSTAEIAASHTSRWKSISRDEILNAGSSVVFTLQKALLLFFQLITWTSQAPLAKVKFLVVRVQPLWNVPSTLRDKTLLSISRWGSCRSAMK